MTTAPDGLPCWADCAYRTEHFGMKHATEFYGRLFGWRIDDTDGYAMCFKGDAPVAALVPTESDQEPFWNVFLATSDLDATVERARAAGAHVIVEPGAVGESGRAAMVRDTVGTVVSFWEAGAHAGYGAIGEMGTPAWHVLLTTDLQGAQRFYADVFGMTFRPDDEYGVTALLPSGTPAFGIHLAEHLPKDVESTWLLSFGVADRDSSAAMAQELDGAIVMTTDARGVPEATLQAPHGEIFGIVQV